MVLSSSANKQYETVEREGSLTMEFSVWEKRAVTGLICGSFIVGLVG